MKLFLIDDDQDDIDFFREAVETIDPAIECHCAYNGQEGITWLLKNKDNLPDFVFLDLNLPRMNGKEFLKAIQQEKSLKNLPVIIFSTSSINADILQTMTLGAKGFITKPTLIGELADKIKQHIHLLPSL